ncbi:MAG: PQQ-binding-like beta-propeller repeat protein [Euryarchaeota archaeon]|nr:PQQ-binding-like beta-propeller repeat protein [Euryarchaeota archaeon]
MVKGDSTNSGFTSDSLAPPLKLSWKASVDGIVLSSPVISQGMVYAGSTSSYVYAFDASSGEIKWRYKTGGWVRWSPAVANEMVYISSEDGYVYALDRITGQLKWKKLSKSTSGKPVSSPIISGNLIYIVSKGPSVVDSGICALDAMTGNPKWCVEAAPEALMDGASPAVFNGNLYIGISDYLNAFDTNDGKLKWKYQTKGVTTPRKPVGMPSVSNGVVYVGSEDYFYAIDAITGKEKWNFGFENIVSSPAIAGNTAYVTSFRKSFINGIDSTTGTPIIKWYTYYYAPSILFSSPTISNNIIYIGSGKYLQAIDIQSGTRKWSYVIDSTISSSPAIANNKLYIGADGYVYAFEKSSEPLINNEIPSPLRELPLFEGYSLVFSKLSFEDGKKEERIAEFELRKNGLRTDSGIFKQKDILQLGKDKDTPIIKGTVDAIFKGATVDMGQLRDITLFSENKKVIVSDIGKITLSQVSGREEVGNNYWKLDNGYLLNLEVYTQSNKAIFTLEKYGIIIDRLFASTGQEFSLKNDSDVTILKGTFEGISKQDNRIITKLTNVVQYPANRIDTKTLINLTDDEIKNIQSEKNNEYKPSQMIMWNLSNGYSLLLQSVDPKESPKQAWLIFSKDGKKLRGMVVAEGQEILFQKQVTTSTGMKDVPILKGKLDRISIDPWYVVISDVNIFEENSGGYLMRSVSFDVPGAISSSQQSINDVKGIFADANNAEYLLAQAREKMWNGQYSESMSLASQAKENAESVKAARINQYMIASIVIAILGIISYRIIKQQRQKKMDEKRRLERIKQEILVMIERVTKNE